MELIEKEQEKFEKCNVQILPILQWKGTPRKSLTTHLEVSVIKRCFVYVTAFPQG